jgi:hypothetical protein
MILLCLLTKRWKEVRFTAIFNWLTVGNRSERRSVLNAHKCGRRGTVKVTHTSEVWDKLSEYYNVSVMVLVSLRSKFKSCCPRNAPTCYLILPRGL